MNLIKKFKNIYNSIFHPQNRWLTKAIPRDRWLDFEDVIEIAVFKGIIFYVEEDVTNAYGCPPEQWLNNAMEDNMLIEDERKFYQELKEIYLLIKNELPKLEGELNKTKEKIITWAVNNRQKLWI